MEKTIFEKIIDGEIPSYKIYEDEHVYSFLDVFPITKGHTLVIPKKHYKNILEVNDETLTHLIVVTKKLANKIVKNLNANGVNILTNANEIAGQTVMHFHIHIIPRYNQDDKIEINFTDRSNDVNLDLILNEINKN